MIVYGSSLSPFVFKVLVAGAEKSMPLDLHEVQLRDTDPVFREASPFGKMPGFRDGDFAISDSSAIITYLDALQPKHSLLPTDPRNRARAVWFDEFADTILADGTLKVFFNRWVAPFRHEQGDLAVAELAERELLPSAFEYLEGVLQAFGEYLVGGTLTLADIAVGAQFVTLDYMGLLPPSARWPRLNTYVTTVMARPTFTALTGPGRIRFDRIKAAMAEEAVRG